MNNVLDENTPTGRAVAISVLPDNRRYAVATVTSPSYSSSGEVVVGADAPFEVFRGRRSSTQVVDAVPHGRFLLAGLTADRVPSRPPPQGMVAPTAAVSRDASLAVSAWERKITPWFGVVAQAAVTFDQGVRAVAVAPRGRRFAAGGERGLINLYFADSVHEPVTLQARGSPVAGLVFSPDGESLGCARDEGSITVYPLGLDCVPAA